MWRRKLSLVLQDRQVDGGNVTAGNKRKIREIQGGEKSRACLGTEEPVVEGGGSPRKALENRS